MGADWCTGPIYHEFVLHLKARGKQYQIAVSLKLIVWLLVGCTEYANQDDLITLGPNTPSHLNINRQLSILDDDIVINSPEEILGAQAKFSPIDTLADLFSPRLAKGLWVKFTLDHRVPHNRKFYLSALTAEYSRLELWQQEGDTLASIGKYGYEIPLHEKVVSSRLPKIPLEVTGEKQVTYFARIQAESMIRIDLLILDEESFFRHDWLGIALVVFAVGGIFVLMGYHIFLWFGFRDKTYLYYSLFLLGMLAVPLTLGGTSEVFAFRPFGMSPILWGRYQYLILPILSILFARSFLSLPENYPKWDLVLKLMVIASIAGLFVIGSGNAELIYSVVDPIIGIISFGIIYSGYYVYRDGYKPAKFYLLGWGLFAITVVVWSMARQGSIETNQWILFLPIFGNLGEALLMSLALGNRIDMLDKRRLKAELLAREGKRSQRLLRVLSHDINNSLTIISSFSSLGLESQDLQKCNKYFEAIERASNNIIQLSENVKKMDAVLSGKTRLDLEAVNINRVFDDAAFIFQQKLKDKGLALEVDLSSPNITVWADKNSLLNEVICNVLSNAIKFSNEGGKIYLKGIEEGDLVLIRIIDEGIGVPLQIAENIFSPTEATSRKGTSNERGTGFGLPIAKEFVEQYGGTIEVRSQQKSDSLAAGTEFRIYLQKYRTTSKIG